MHSLFEKAAICISANAVVTHHSYVMSTHAIPCPSVYFDTQTATKSLIIYSYFHTRIIGYFSRYHYQIWITASEDISCSGTWLGIQRILHTRYAQTKASYINSDLTDNLFCQVRHNQDPWVYNTTASNWQLATGNRRQGRKTSLPGACHGYIDQPATRLNLTGTKLMNWQLGPGSWDYTSSILDIHRCMQSHINRDVTGKVVLQDSGGELTFGISQYFNHIIAYRFLSNIRHVPAMLEGTGLP